MHTGPVPGTFETDWKPANFQYASCPKCGSKDASYREWESSCSGYKDLKYRCNACGHTWWVEGSDA